MANTQQAIMELIANEPLSAATIASHLAISEGYIRTQLKAMEIGGLIEKTDNRMPYYYRLAPTNLLVEEAERILQMKKALLLPVGNDDTKIEKLIKSAPKDKWEELARALRLYGAAIEALVAEGKAVDTL